MLQLDGSRWTGPLTAQNIADFLTAGIGRYVAGTEQGIGSTYTAQQLDACARGGLAKALYVYLDPARSAAQQVVDGQQVAGQAVLDFVALDAEDEGYPADPSVVVPILQSARAAVRADLPVWWYCGKSWWESRTGGWSPPAGDKLWLGTNNGRLSLDGLDIPAGFTEAEANQAWWDCGIGGVPKLDLSFCRDAAPLSRGMTVDDIVAMDELLAGHVVMNATEIEPQAPTTAMPSTTGDLAALYLYVKTRGAQNIGAVSIERRPLDSRGHQQWLVSDHLAGLPAASWLVGAGR